jgi:hypothetical protein
MTTHDFRTPPSVLTWEHLKGLMLDRLGNGPSCECDDCQRTRRVMRAVELEQRQERAGWPALFAAAEGDRNRNRRTGSGPTNLENQRVNDVTG